MLNHKLYIPPDKIAQIIEWCLVNIPPDNWELSKAHLLGDGLIILLNENADAVILKLKFNIYEPSWDF